MQTGARVEVTMSTESSPARDLEPTLPKVRKTMKRFVLAFFLVAVCATVSEAQQTVLAPDGTLFTIDTVSPELTNTNANQLVLRMQRNEAIIEEIVPASIDDSRHAYPVVAYDPVSESVFVFWLRHLGTMSSQLTFACRNSDGVWSQPKEFGSPFIFREHLRMAVTSRVASEDGVVSSEGAISVHLAWWEFDSHTGNESARYAMVPIEDGAVADVIEVDLASFVDVSAAGPEDLDLSILKQPLLHTSPTRDSVLITFGDIETRSLHQVRFRPTKIVSDTRIRIPIGRTEGAIGAPRFPVAANAHVEGAQADGGLVLYVSLENTLQYVALKNGKWSATRTIALDSVTTREVALNAIRRLALEQ